MRTYFFLVAVCFVGVYDAQGADVEFGGRFDVLNNTSGSSVFTNGRPCVAGNINGTEPAVINGVSFDPVSPGTSVSDNGVVVSLVDLGNGRDFSNHDRVSAFYDVNPGLRSLMRSSFKSAYYANGMALQISGLTVGQTYQLQGIYWDGGPNTSLYVRNASDPENQSGTLFTQSPAQGASWLATWTADTPEMTLEICPGRSSRSILSGFSLRQVEEPLDIEFVYSWESLNVGGLMWDDSVGLWQNPKIASHEGDTGGVVVHNSRFNAGALLLAARYGLLDDPRFERALLALRGMQDPATGSFRGNFEDVSTGDSNYSFFVCRLLLLLKNCYADQLASTSERVIDEMLNTSYLWFYKAAMEDKAYYPNAYLGELVCAKLIQEIYPHRNDEVAAVKERMMQSAHYWQEAEWGWGEHLSDTYSGTCMDLISLYLLFTKGGDASLYSEYKALLDELLQIEDMYGEGPRVPAIRSYSFSARGGLENYRDQIVSWNPKRIESNHFWREKDLIKALYHDADWHRRIDFPREPSVRDVSIPCFGGVVATAIIADDIRLGSLSEFPLMPDAENLTWGLAWQSFPVALWTPKGDWGFLQWQTVEDCKVKAHPANNRTGARALTSSINPPFTGKTYSIQRGGDILVVRIMPAIMQTWECVSDSFKLINGTAVLTELSPVDPSFNQLLLEYLEKTVSICNIPSVSGLMPEIEKEGNAVYWKLEYPASALRQMKTMKMIVDVWGISLNGKVSEAPVIKFEENHQIPLVEVQQKRRLTWQWPKTKWDVTIDPMAATPLQVVE
jgi:hypothetical protein